MWEHGALEWVRLTSDEIRAQLTHAEVIGADIPVYRTCHDYPTADMQCLDRVTRFIENLYRLAILGSEKN